MKTKITRILGVAMTVALLVGLFVTAAPLSAGTNSWSAFGIPKVSTTGAGTLTTGTTGMLAQGADGTLYVYDSSGTLANDLFKSTDGGFTWAAVAGWNIAGVTPAIIAPSATDGSVIYIVGSDGIVRRSFDGGATPFTSISNPDGSTVNSIDTTLMPSGYLIVLGTTTGVWTFDESQPLLPWQQQMTGNTMAANFSPTYPTDLVIVAVTATGTVTYKVGAGAFGAEIATATLTGVSAVTKAAIAFPAGYSASTNNVLLIGVTATGGDVFSVYGSTVPASIIVIDRNIDGTGKSKNVNSMDMSGSTVLVGATDGKVYRSTTAGVSWSKASKAPTGSGMVIVSIDNADATKAYALTAGAEGGLHVSADTGSTWNGISLMVTTISSITNMGVSGGTVFAMTRDTSTAVGGSAAIAADAFTITSTASGPAAAAAVAQVDTVTPTVVINTTYILSVTPSGGSAQLFVYTSSGAATATEICDAFRALVNANPMAVTASGTTTLILTADVAGVAAGFTTVDAGTGVLGIVNTQAAVDAVLATTIDVVTLAVTAGSVTVTGFGAGTYTSASALATFTYTAVGQVSTVTAGANATAITLTATVGAATLLETVDVDTDQTVAYGAMTMPDAAVAAVTASLGTDSIWRKAGTNWERVYQSTLFAAADMLAGTPAGDAIFVAAAGGSTIYKSTTDGQKWSKLSPAIPTGATVGSLLAIDASTLVVGDAGVAGRIHATAATGPLTWLTTNTVALGLVTSLARDATTGDLLAAGMNTIPTPDVGAVALSQDGGTTWKLVNDGKTVPTVQNVAVDTSIIAVFGHSYATTGEMFATGENAAGDGNVWKRTTGKWSQVDKIGTGAQSGTDDVVDGLGLVSAPGVVDMVYAVDGSAATEGVLRIKSNRSEGEQLAGPTATTFMGLWYTPGSNVLWTIDTTAPNIYSYTDTTNVAGSGVAVSLTPSAAAPFAATITWNALADMVLSTTSSDFYAVFVHTTKQTNYYTAVNSPTLAANPVISTTAESATVNLPAANTKYYVSVWAVNTASSFLFGGAPTEVTTPVVAPTGAANLVPIAGATNVPILPAFQWAPVAGATGYLMELGTDPTFASATQVVIPSASPFFAWATELEYSTNYYWRVQASGTSSSTWVSSVFTTMAAPVVPPDPVEPGDITLLPTPVNIEQITPAYIWAIIAVGFVLTVAVIILIVRTRRVV